MHRRTEKHMRKFCWKPVSPGKTKHRRENIWETKCEDMDPDGFIQDLGPVAGSSIEGEEFLD